MDLTNIKRRLSKGQIWTTAQFQQDLMLMFQNAVMYNSSDHHVHRMAVEMQRDVLEQLQLLAPVLRSQRDRAGVRSWSPDLTPEFRSGEKPGWRGTL
ncbi:unnamed protein product [Caretta caretta]